MRVLTSVYVDKFYWLNKITAIYLYICCDKLKEAREAHEVRLVEGWIFLILKVKDSFGE